MDHVWILEACFDVVRTSILSVHRSKAGAQAAMLAEKRERAEMEFDDIDDYRIRRFKLQR